MNQKLLVPLDLQKKEHDKSIVYFSLPNLVHGSHKLILHQGLTTLSLIGDGDNGPNPVQQKKLSDNELQIIVPILDVFPHYCPYEVLLASIISRMTIESTVTNWQLRLQEAQSKGTWQQEIRPLHHALTSLQ